MSYSLTISGHKNTETDEESVQFEQDVAAKARAFVQSLEGVSAAYGQFGSTGSQNLLEPAP